MALSKIDVANMLTGLVPNDNTIRRPNASPIFINGNMAVAQRGTSATGKSSGGYYTCDRIKLNPDSLGTWTVIQESLTSGEAYNNGFRKAFRIIGFDKGLLIVLSLGTRPVNIFATSILLSAMFYSL